MVLAGLIYCKVLSETSGLTTRTSLHILSVQCLHDLCPIILVVLVNTGVDSCVWVVVNGVATQ